MICDTHKLFIRVGKCPHCERERKELEYEIRMAEIENSQPIIIWEGKS